MLQKKKSKDCINDCISMLCSLLLSTYSFPTPQESVPPLTLFQENEDVTQPPESEMKEKKLVSPRIHQEREELRETRPFDGHISKWDLSGVLHFPQSETTLENDSYLYDMFYNTWKSYSEMWDHMPRAADDTEKKEDYIAEELASQESFLKDLHDTLLYTWKSYSARLWDHWPRADNDTEKKEDEQRFTKLLQTDQHPLSNPRHWVYGDRRSSFSLPPLPSPSPSADEAESAEETFIEAEGNVYLGPLGLMETNPSLFSPSPWPEEWERKEDSNSYDMIYDFWKSYSVRRIEMSPSPSPLPERNAK
jgi:hypothetical protein